MMRWDGALESQMLILTTVSFWLKKSGRQKTTHLERVAKTAECEASALQTGQTAP